jgi:rhodanese-related sulfurtransferase
MPKTIQRTTVDELRALLAHGGDGQVVDVREFTEYEAERIAGARLIPLSAFVQQAGGIDRERPVFLVCRSGTRAAQAAEQLAQLGHPDVRIVEGGIQAWVAAGYPVECGTSRVWSLERQVRFAAGTGVLLGVGLAWVVHPWFTALTAFIGAGLVFSAVTDTCGMGLVLARMPWNQRPTDRGKLLRLALSRQRRTV